MAVTRNAFSEIYAILFAHFGAQNWWPAEKPFEMVVGAVLTQNTSWSNVEKAISNLKAAHLLSVDALLNVDHVILAAHLRPAGYYNLKAKRLRNLVQMIVAEYDGEIHNLLTDDFHNSRAKLLQVNGIGKETADSILLYAGDHPIFVVDAYTHRVFSRHNLLAEESSYAEIQEKFMDSLPADSILFNEYHALIVKVAKVYCRKNKPLCENCPLNSM